MSEWLAIILTSGVVAGIVTGLMNWLVFKKQKAHEFSLLQLRDLYAPIYIRIVQTSGIDKRIDDLAKVEYQKAQEKAIEKDQKVKDDYVRTWWLLVDDLFKLLNKNAYLLDLKDIEPVSYFLNEYKHREIEYGKTGGPKLSLRARKRDEFTSIVEKLSNHFKTQYEQKRKLLSSK